MITSLIAHGASYAGMFTLLAGSALFVPVPEEITLLVSGFFIAHGFLEPVRAALVAICAILLGDSIIFFLAKTGSRYATGFHERLKHSGLEKTWILSPDSPLRAVFILRFFTGLRVIAAIFAGLNGATWAGFLATDAAATVIFVPAVLWLGYHFAGTFLQFVAIFEVIRHVFFWSIVAFVGGEVLFTISPRLHRLVGRMRGKKADEDASHG